MGLRSASSLQLDLPRTHRRTIGAEHSLLPVRRSLMTKQNAGVKRPGAIAGDLGERGAGRGTATTAALQILETPCIINIRAFYTKMGHIKLSIKISQNKTLHNCK